MGENDEEEAKIREAMTILGKRTSERKKAASRANAAKRVVTPELRAKMAESQRLRREREHAEALARGEIVEVEKYTRPKKKQTRDGGNAEGA